MKYDNDTYSGDDYDDELWNDELDINTDDSGQESYGYSTSSDIGGGAVQNDDPDTADDDEDNGYGSHDSYKDEPAAENDFYSSDEEPVKAKKPKAPKLDPEDPDYWIEEESELDSILHKTKNKWKWQLGGALTLLLLIFIAWIWFFRPYADDAVRYGYIRNMERRGSLIKTFEGTMIPYKELGDPNPMYFEEVRFSVAGDSLAARMKRMMLDCVPVRVEYEVYHAPLPWKGEEKMIITKVDSADPERILPPEYRYYR